MAGSALVTLVRGRPEPVVTAPAPLRLLPGGHPGVAVTVLDEAGLQHLQAFDGTGRLTYGDLAAAFPSPFRIPPAELVRLPSGEWQTRPARWPYHEILITLVLALHADAARYAPLIESHRLAGERRATSARARQRPMPRAWEARLKAAARQLMPASWFLTYLEQGDSLPTDDPSWPAVAAWLLQTPMVLHGAPFWSDVVLYLGEAAAAEARKAAPEHRGFAVLLDSLLACTGPAWPVPMPEGLVPFLMSPHLGLREAAATVAGRA